MLHLAPLHLLQQSARQLPRELLRALLRPQLSSPLSTSSTVLGPGPAFSYLHATSFFPKPRSKVAAEFKGFPPSHPIARWRDEVLKQEGAEEWGAGQDFWMVHDRQNENGTDGVLVVGVADGVGGWEESKVDPSLFSMALMYFAKRRVEIGTTLPNLRQVLWDAFRDVQAEEAVPAGSSTAQLLSFAPSGHLSALNLGDSTFFILRQGNLIHSQPPQTHFFNAPRQCAKMPRGLKPQPGSFVDTPDDADEFECQLEDGDVVLSCTDGFSDNVWPAELVQLWALVKGHEGVTSEQDMVDKFAVACVNYARLCSYKEDKVSPFEDEARRLKVRGYRELVGGKVDDCTVVAVLVRAARPSE